jgi:MFS family permease
VHGYNALESGVAFLPMTAGIIFGSVLAQNLIRRVGAKIVLLGGLGLAALGMAWMTTLSPTDSYATGMLPGLILLALGMGNAFVPLTLVATTGHTEDDQGLASGLFNTAQQVGGALGLAVLSTVAGNVTSSQLGSGVPRIPALVDGFTTAFAIGALMILAGGVLALFGLRSSDVPASAEIDVEDAAVAVPA